MEANCCHEKGAKKQAKKFNMVKNKNTYYKQKLVSQFYDILI